MNHRARVGLATTRAKDGRGIEPARSPAREPSRTAPVPSAARWDRIYTAHGESELSWHQDDPVVSLELIRKRVGPEGRIIDAGAGSSILCGKLAAEGYRHLTAVDLSSGALARARLRMAGPPGSIRRIVGDVSRVPLPGRVDLWHDRALFHFLTHRAQRERYVAAVRRSLVPGGWLVLAEFARDGPPRCSGQGVRRYEGDELAPMFGPEFTLREEQREMHRTPWGAEQAFLYSVLRRGNPGVGSGAGRRRRNDPPLGSFARQKRK